MGYLAGRREGGLPRHAVLIENGVDLVFLPGIDVVENEVGVRRHDRREAELLGNGAEGSPVAGAFGGVLDPSLGDVDAVVASSKAAAMILIDSLETQI